MDSNKLANWLQVGANVGLISGLVLVAVQINQNSEQLSQNHELARSELVSIVYDAWITIDSSQQSENFAETMSKSFEHPTELTVAEMIELDGHFFSLFDQLRRSLFLNQNGVFRKGIGVAAFGVINALNSSYAQAWWAENRQEYEPEIVELVDRQLPDISNNSALHYYHRIQARLSQ